MSLTYKVFKIDYDDVLQYVDDEPEPTRSDIEHEVRKLNEEYAFLRVRYEIFGHHNNKISRDLAKKMDATWPKFNVLSEKALEHKRKNIERHKELIKSSCIEDLQSLMMSDSVPTWAKEMVMVEVHRTLLRKLDFQAWFKCEVESRKAIIVDLDEEICEGVHNIRVEKTASLCTKLVALDNRAEEILGLFYRKFDAEELDERFC